jgi:hypothetical protein
MNTSLVRFRDSLVARQIDFDYGDEEMLPRLSRIAREGGKAILTVGKAKYRAIAVPPTLTLRATTLALLEKFHRAGGTVVWAGGAPAMVDAKPSDAARKLAATGVTAPPHGPKLAALLADVRRVAVTAPGGKECPSVLAMLTEDANAFYAFLVNTGEDMTRCGENHDQQLARDRTLAVPRATVTLPGAPELAGAPAEIDLSTGAIFAADAAKGKDGWTVATSFEPLASRMFVFPKKKQAAKLPLRPRLKETRRTSLGNRFDVVRSEANVLVLDRPAHAIGKGKMQKPDEVLQVDHKVREALGLRRRGGEMVQPWARPKVKDPKTTPVTLVYTFRVDAPVSGALFLALEQPARWRINLNGRAVSTDADGGSWVDRSLRKLPLEPSALRLGDNELTLSCDYEESHPGLEIIYLLGEFGVKLDGTTTRIVGLPTELKVGDWTAQGLPFYAGHVAYTKKLKVSVRKGERVFASAPDFRGAALRFTVDGRVAGVAGWAPWEADITDLAADGKEHVVAIEVIGHRRNSHGPFHINERWPMWTTPGSYQKGDHWREAYAIVPCGLLKPPALSFRSAAKTGSCGKTKTR